MFLVNRNTNMQVPLENIFFDVDILGTRIARIQMVQSYINSSTDTPLETQFFFPVDIDFALHKIRVEYEDLSKGEKITVETKMEERKKAEKIYEDSIVQGDTMAVLAQHVTVNKKSVISCNLGNFPPNSKATLTCFMSTQLPVNTEGFAFRLPLCFI